MCFDSLLLTSFLALTPCLALTSFLELSVRKDDKLRHLILTRPAHEVLCSLCSSRLPSSSIPSDLPQAWVGILSFHLLPVLFHTLLVPFYLLTRTPQVLISRPPRSISSIGFCTVFLSHSSCIFSGVEAVEKSIRSYTAILFTFFSSFFLIFFFSFLQ